MGCERCRNQRFNLMAVEYKDRGRSGKEEKESSFLGEGGEGLYKGDTEATIDVVRTVCYRSSNVLHKSHCQYRLVSSF